MHYNIISVNETNPYTRNHSISLRAIYNLFSEGIRYNVIEKYFSSYYNYYKILFYLQIQFVVLNNDSDEVYSFLKSHNM